MTYSAILTSKGTTTIPVAFRKKLGMKPGTSLTFSQGKNTRQIVIERSLTIEEVRAMNQTEMKRAGTWDKPYYSGAGFEAHVLEKYGKNQRG